uniref:CSON002269 protein n=1 Tax=Culicoides sonorensis TaxID=179676 RepID=A0A336M3Y9_CULSO
MKLSILLCFISVIFFQIILSLGNHQETFQLEEKIFNPQFDEILSAKNPLIQYFNFKKMMGRIKELDTKAKNTCFNSDSSNVKCGLLPKLFKDSAFKFGKNMKSDNLIDLFRNTQKILVGAQSTNMDLETNNTDVSQSGSDQHYSLTAEEPRYVIINKEYDNPLKFDSRNFWEFIPPRGRKGYFDINEDTFIPNRGKKVLTQEQKKRSKSKQIAFDLNEDFYPVRGRRIPDELQDTPKQSLYDDELFYPNRGKRLSIKGFNFN